MQRFATMRTSIIRVGYPDRRVTRAYFAILASINCVPYFHKNGTIKI